MIKMVKVKDVKIGMVISTDGLVVGHIHDYTKLLGTISIGGMCCGTWKEELFRPEYELPIWEANDA